MQLQPCDWEIFGCDGCDALNNLDEDVRLMVEQRAINRLWEWTNRRFGPCPVSFRPCRQRCAEGYGTMWGIPQAAGRFINLNCGSCGTACSCSFVSEIILPGPINAPLEILIDGEELPLWAVRVDNWNRLVRIDGGRFPTCQHLGRPPDEPGTWQVTYAKGEPVPAGGGIVAGILACEYAKAMCNDDSCRFPKRLTSITRQGMSMAILDNFDKMGLGQTGIWEIDDFVTTYTTNLRSGPWQMGQVSSPDLTPLRFTTWDYYEDADS